MFSINLTHAEIQLLRQSLDMITLNGKDAKFVANLQVTLEKELMQIQEILEQQEIQKQQDLQDIIARENKKNKKAQV